MVTTPRKPALPAKASLDDAKRFVRALVRWVGPGFHPDTDFHDYVITTAGARSYEPAEADRLNADLDRAVEILGAAGIDPCGIALPVQRRLLRSMGVK